MGVEVETAGKGYFITACNEYEELAKLLILLRTNIQKSDCIGILLDEENCTKQVSLLKVEYILKVMFQNKNMNKHCVSICCYDSFHFSLQ